MSTIDDIKSRIDLAEYLREQGIDLKPAGASVKACCPFHNEKTPSFMVNREKQVWYCFGCSKGGDLFTFVQEREGMEFGEALRYLADRAGVVLEARDPRLEGRKTRMLAVLDTAMRFFQAQLARSDVAAAYVAERKIAQPMLEQFQIGYASDAWDTLTAHLLQKGFRPQEMVEAGVAIQSHKPTATSHPDSVGAEVGVQSSARVYDRFRHRLMFPIHDAMGRVVGFTGRILDGGRTVGEAPAKYVNTPETELYTKGATIYGLSFAKQAIRTSGYAVLVEGNMDVVTSHGAGFAQTIATSGTALAEAQLKQLRRYTSVLHVAFDADRAGEGAAERGIDLALDAGFDVRVIRMPSGADGKPVAKDPDECILRAPEAWAGAIAAPLPLIDDYLVRIRTTFDLRSPAGQRDAGRLLVARLRHIPDPIERAAWVRRVAGVIGVPESAIADAVRDARTASAPREQSSASYAVAPSPVLPVAPIERLANRTLALALRFPDTRPLIRPHIDGSVFPNEWQRTLYNRVVVEYAGGERGQPNALVSDSNFLGYVERLELLADREFGELAALDRQEEASRSARWLRREFLTSELQRIALRLRQLEQGVSGNAPVQEETAALEQRFRELTNALSVLS